MRLIDGRGGEAFGAVSREPRGRTSVFVESARQASPREVEIALAAPLLKMPRLSWLVEKASELGVARVELVASERSQGNRVSAAGFERARLEKIAAEAIKQSGQIFFPEIVGPTDGEQLLSPRGGENFVFDPSGGTFPAKLVGPRVDLWIGPEGGFTADEVRLAKRAGWKVVRLFSSVLRSETAAIAALCLALSAIDTAGRPGGQ